MKGYWRLGRVLDPNRPNRRPGIVTTRARGWAITVVDLGFASLGAVWMRQS